MDGDDIIFYEDDVIIMSSVYNAVVEVEWEVRWKTTASMNDDFFKM